MTTYMEALYWVEGKSVRRCGPSTWQSRWASSARDADVCRSHTTAIVRLASPAAGPQCCSISVRTARVLGCNQNPL